MEVEDTMEECQVMMQIGDFVASSFKDVDNDGLKSSQKMMEVDS